MKPFVTTDKGPSSFNVDVALLKKDTKNSASVKPERDNKLDINPDRKPDILSRYDSLKNSAQELIKRQSFNKTDADIMVLLSSLSDLTCRPRR